MHRYHYYARARLDNGKFQELDGVIGTSQPIRGDREYRKLKEYLAAETRAEIQRLTIISLSYLGSHSDETG